jgi:hypothetical protein
LFTHDSGGDDGQGNDLRDAYIETADPFFAPYRQDGQLSQWQIKVTAQSTGDPKYFYTYIQFSHPCSRAVLTPKTIPDMLVKVGDSASIQTISAFNYDLEGTWDCGAQTATLDCDLSSPALTVVCPSALVPGSVMDLHLEGALSSDVGVTHPCLTVTFDQFPMATVSTSTFALTVEMGDLIVAESDPCLNAMLTNAVWDGSASNPMLYTYRLGLRA